VTVKCTSLSSLLRPANHSQHVNTEVIPELISDLINKRRLLYAQILHHAKLWKCWRWLSARKWFLQWLSHWVTSFRKTDFVV